MHFLILLDALSETEFCFQADHFLVMAPVCCSQTTAILSLSPGVTDSSFRPYHLRRYINKPVNTQPVPQLAFPSSRVQESLSSITVVDEADTEPGQRGSLPATEEDVPERQNPFRPCSWRLDVAQQECARDSGRYLHNILH